MYKIYKFLFLKFLAYKYPQYLGITKILMDMDEFVGTDVINKRFYSTPLTSVSYMTPFKSRFYSTSLTQIRINSTPDNIVFDNNKAALFLPSLGRKLSFFEIDRK